MPLTATCCLHCDRPTRFGAEYCCGACEAADIHGLLPLHTIACDEHHYGNASVSESGARLAERRRG